MITNMELYAKLKNLNWPKILEKNAETNRESKSHVEIAIHLSYDEHSPTSFKVSRDGIISNLIKDGFYEFSRINETSLLFKVRILKTDRIREYEANEKKVLNILKKFNKLRYSLTAANSNLIHSNYGDKDLEIEIKRILEHKIEHLANILYF